MKRGLAAAFLLALALGGAGLLTTIRRPPDPLTEMTGAMAAVDTTQFCTTVAGLGFFTGDYTCLNGNGTTANSTIPAFAAVGSPVSESTPVCSNGSDCSAMASMRLPALSHYSTANTASPADDFVACVFHRPDSFPFFYVAKGAASIYLGSSGTGAYGSDIAGGSSANGGNAYIGSAQLVCLLYDRGDLDTWVYINGESTGTDTSSGTVGVENTPWHIGAITGGGFDYVGNIFGGFVAYTDRATAQALMDDLAYALLPQPTLSGGTRFLANTRGDDRFCCNAAETACSNMHNSQTCVNGLGVLHEPQHNNRLWYSDDFGQATWTKLSVTVTSNSATPAPDGTRTADLLTSTIVGGYVEQAFSGRTLTGGVGSVWVRTTAGTQAGILELYDATALASACQVPYTATTTWQRVKNCRDATVVAGSSLRMRIYPSGLIGTGAHLVWGAQGEEQTSHTTAHVRTSGAVSGSGRDAIAITTLPAYFTNFGDAISWSWDYTPETTTGTDTARVFLLLGKGAGPSSREGFEDLGTGNIRMARDYGGADNIDSTDPEWTAGTTYHLTSTETAAHLQTWTRDGVVIGTGTHLLGPYQTPTFFNLGGASETYHGYIKDLCFGAAGACN